MLPQGKDEPQFSYVVTAAHCVRSETDTWVRVQRKGGEEVEDLAVQRWIFHPSEDIAVTPAPLDAGAYRWVAMNSDRFDPRRKASSVLLGMPVYFIGLLPTVPEMGRANIPMVRSGTLGALYQSGVPLRIGPGTTYHVTAHLVDCRSYKGFSGSPCFVQGDTLFWLPGIREERWAHEDVGPGEAESWLDPFSLPGMQQIEYAQQGTTALLGLREHWLQANTRLLGVMTAHFPEPADPMSHAGVGVVTPAEHIWEVLMTDELRTDRTLRTKAHREAG